MEGLEEFIALWYAILDIEMVLSIFLFSKKVLDIICFLSLIFLFNMFFNKKLFVF